MSMWTKIPFNEGTTGIERSTTEEHFDTVKEAINVKMFSPFHISWLFRFPKALGECEYFIGGTYVNN